MALPIAQWTQPPFVPDPSNILSGLATSNAATIITIPAGRTWMGTVTISASAVVAVAGAAINASARVSTAGSGVIPATGDYIRLDLGAPASGTALTGTASNSSISSPLTVSAPATNSVTLVLNVTNTTVQNASAIGVLL